MKKIKSVAVYCGSSMGNNDIYQKQAIEFAKELVKRDIALVYGGASVGLMGTIADTVLSLGGKAIGVIPSLLEEREISHKNLTELYKVDTMHQRKSKMIELADGFVAMPGGYGTLEEYSEVFTWSQIGLHTKPCGLFNINHYWQPLIDMTNKMADEGFLHEKYRHMAIVESSPADLLDQFETYIAPPVKTYD
ncbi:MULTISPECIES: TIGR00730 family Rossman fold protein [Providencia]|uniref:Cytokinin riboside 5'-monophosphate phosphoribohydrolase n=3 Tax=Providencia alcalifaciens TaxID=126385 RepID=A0AAW9VF93_9GAMM|nr:MULTISPECIES: TIGR00730 family Rossman fold protein [Providencia]EKT65659.1 lysine decarboxylase [Providencia alcalifaciens Dmel2]ATG18136.1 TIGR00730 family Rossman fold protein [Providencia alcalifaciens]EEB44723.1 TIGR00730 family protein [Providencia alcalifaciens DSM 30120]EUD04316.1 TIGR00730 family protein [Providencia alcalifaciens RIMD 1656011]EUD08738.1 TIGR00730 family protein [Providencia alcalifaciens R90-1475]